MSNLYIALMLLCGAGLAVQIAVNVQLRVVSGSALWAANIVFLASVATGLLAFAGAVIFGTVSPPLAALWQAPPWVWLGGVFGAIYVLVAIVLAGQLGAALVSATSILGQLGASILIDHYGWFGMPVQPATPARLVGAGLLAAGVVLIRWK